MGRVLTFSDADVIRMASKDFIPVVGDDWYQRRRRDAEGEFFRAVANQGPRKHDGVSGPTRQGMYLFTASGKLLGYRNNHDPNNMRREIRQALEKFKQLPATETQPGAVKVDDLPEEKLDDQYHRAPPKDGLILRAEARVLERTDDGGYANCSTIPSGVRGIFASRDHVWIKADEWRAMVPDAPKVGEKIKLPAKIVERLCRFHLLDNTRGEPTMWRRDDVRPLKMTMSVTKVTDARVELRFTGRALLTTDADLDKAKRGYDAHLRGEVVFDRAAKRFTAFDIVALGDHWGEGRYDRGARPGRTPLGIAFTLVSPDEPANRVPPQASRSIGEYYGR